MTVLAIVSLVCGVALTLGSVVLLFMAMAGAVASDKDDTASSLLIGAFLTLTAVVGIALATMGATQ